MIRIPSWLLAAGVFFAGLLAGIYLQHRWPVGRWGEDTGPALEPAAMSVAQVASLDPERRLVLLIAGQSNAANYGSVRADAGPGVYAWHDGALSRARDPLPGADQYRGSPWTRLGASLMLSRRYDAVVLVSLAQGSTRAADWAPGGKLHDRLQETMFKLREAGLPPDFILWQQGEAEAGDPSATGSGYLATMAALVSSTQSSAPHPTWVIARATYLGTEASSAQIREAQRLAATLPGARPGPDIDVLDGTYRSDGIHLNGRGLDAAAALWREALEPLLTNQTQP